MICDLLALRPISHITQKTLSYLHSTKIEQITKTMVISKRGAIFLCCVRCDPIPPKTSVQRLAHTRNVTTCCSTEEDSLDHIQIRILWILAGTQTLIYFSFRSFGKHPHVRERKINCLFSSSPTLDCDQSLFFFRFSKGSARTREC